MKVGIKRLENRTNKQDEKLAKLEHQFERYEKERKIFNIIIKIEKWLDDERKIQVNVTETFKISKTPGKKVILVKLRDKGQKIKVLQNKIRENTENKIKNRMKVKVGYQKLYNQEKTYTWDKKINDLKLIKYSAQPPKN